MNKYAVTIRVNLNASAIVEADSESEAVALFEYAWNFEECEIEFFDTITIDCVKLVGQPVSLPLLETAWCRQKVLECLEDETELED